jgi:hypothetical protein
MENRVLILDIIKKKKTNLKTWLSVLVFGVRDLLDLVY